MHTEIPMELLEITEANKSEQDDIVESLAHIRTCNLEKVLFAKLAEHSTLDFDELEGLISRKCYAELS